VAGIKDMVRISARMSGTAFGTIAAYHAGIRRRGPLAFVQTGRRHDPARCLKRRIDLSVGR
jgi:hypothetical protein